jgi:hypothetical protein
MEQLLEATEIQIEAVEEHEIVDLSADILEKVGGGIAGIYL